MKKEYIKPRAIDLSKTTDEYYIFKTANSLANATAEEISDIFSMGINPDIKKHFDYVDLCRIASDVDRYEEFLYFNPDKYVSEKQLYTKNMHLSKEESDELRPYPSEPRLRPETIIQALIDNFIYKIEDIIGQTTCINDIKQIDGIYDSITLMKPRLRNKNGKYMNNKDNIDNYGFTNVITEIRNGLMHNSYIIYGNNVYINNPEGGIDNSGFEAVVSCDFFNMMYRFGRGVSRRPKSQWINDHDIKWKKGYQANKDNIKIYTESTKKSNELMDLREQGIYLHQNATSKMQPLSEGQKELLEGFFEEHDFCNKNLIYAIIGTREKNMGIDFWYHERSPSRRQDYLLGMRDDSFYAVCPCNNRGRDIWHALTQGDNINNRLIWEDNGYILEFLEDNWRKGDLSRFTKQDLLKFEKYLSTLKSVLGVFKDMVFNDEFRLHYLKILYISKFFINNPTLELAQPQKREGVELKNQCINFITNKCKSRPDIYRSRESKKDKLDKALGHDYWLRIFKQFRLGSSRDKIIQEAFQDKRITLDQREILKNNIIYVIEKWEKQLDEVTIIQEPEHIRNAFAHHNYTIIPGYNKILLEDPSRDDFPDRRKVYDIDELYKKCIRKTGECFLGIKETHITDHMLKY